MNWSELLNWYRSERRKDDDWSFIFIVIFNSVLSSNCLYEKQAWQVASRLFQADHFEGSERIYAELRKLSPQNAELTSQHVRAANNLLMFFVFISLLFFLGCETFVVRFSSWTSKHREFTDQAAALYESGHQATAVATMEDAIFTDQRCVHVGLRKQLAIMYMKDERFNEVTCVYLFKIYVRTSKILKLKK